MTMSRVPHCKFRIWVGILGILSGVMGCRSASESDPPSAINTPGYGFGYIEKDFDYLFNEYVNNPCIENKLATLDVIRNAHIHQGDTEENRLAAALYLHKCAVHARLHWQDEPIKSCGGHKQAVVKRLLKEDQLLGPTMQTQAFSALAVCASFKGHPTVESRALELFKDLEPDDTSSWLHERWQKSNDWLSAKHADNK